MIRFDKLTQRAQEALEGAVDIVRRGKQQEVDVEHLFLTLLEQKESIVSPLLEKMGVSIFALREDLKGIISSRAKVEGKAVQPHFSSRLVRVLERLK